MVYVVLRGLGGPSSLLEHGVTRQVFDNPATGTSLTSVATITEKDLRATVNGDGPSTIRWLATGNAVPHGSDGKAYHEEPR